MKNLQLVTLRNWPPLASHLAFLLLGVASANLFPFTMTAEPRLAKRKIFLNLPFDARQLPISAHANPSSMPMIGSKLWPIQSLGGRADCRLSSTPFTILGIENSLLLMIDNKDATALPLVLAAEKSQQLRFLDEQASLTLKACRAQRSVRYVQN